MLQDQIQIGAISKAIVVGQGMDRQTIFWIDSARVPVLSVERSAALLDRSVDLGAVSFLRFTSRSGLNRI